MTRTAAGARRRKRQRLAAGVGLVVTALIALLLVRASGVAHEPSRLAPLTELEVPVERAARSLADYIRIDTSTPPGIGDTPPPPHLALLLERYVRPLGLEHEVLEGRSLLVRWRAPNTEQRPALYLSHADVVPVADEERPRWTHPPFAGVVRDGWVWGRGALDNKASTICQLEAIAALSAAGLSPRRDILLLVVPDEEIGGERGTGRVVARHFERLGDPAVVFDEGSFLAPDFVPGVVIAAVAVGEKRFVTLELRVTSAAGHSSMPRPDDAPRVLSAALGRLSDFQLPARILPPVDTFLDRISDRMSFGRRIALKNRWLFGGLVRRQLEQKPASNAMIRDTMAITILRAGVKDNVVPAEAVATVNLRLLPGSDLDVVLGHLETVIADPRVDIRVVTDWGDTPVSPIEGEAWDRLESALATAMPDAVVAPMITPGTMDARFFAQRGVPAYRLVPFTLDAEERAGVHGIDERVSLDNLEQAIQVYAHMMRHY